VAQRIETLLPVGPRPRQCSVRALLVGMLACQAQGRPAHLVRVHDALTALSQADQRRLGVTVDWKRGPHTLTYRQVEYTFGRVVAALSQHTPDGTPSDLLAGVVDDVVEASLPATHKATSSSLAIDWTDLESWAEGPHSDGATADTEASWGRRRSHAIGHNNEVFYGYYFSAAVTVADENRPALPELIRRITLTTCSRDPVPAMVPVLQRLAASGVPLGDVIADSGYAHRLPAHWALPLRALGARIVTDLHPHDRGPHGTHAGAIMANGNLYCPATPPALLTIAPPARAASAEQIAAHHQLTAEAARYKLSPLSADDPDGYHRVACPATTGKIRCPHRPDSIALPYHRPTITTPPQQPPTCCTQATLTVPPSVNAKTRQKLDYPGTAWRHSYARRTGVERAYSTLKDPATNNINRGWCRLMGLTAITLFLAATTAARNLRIADAFNARATQDAHRAATANPPRTRRRRRKTITDLANAPP
jgi:hypothetical protein